MTALSNDATIWIEMICFLHKMSQFLNSLLKNIYILAQK